MRRYTTEQLIKVVEANKNAPVRQRNSNEVHRFINDLDIKAGKNLVIPRMIFKAYLIWTSESRPFTSQKFFPRFSGYFTPHNSRVKGGRYYLLNYTAVQLLNKVDNGRVRF